MMQNETYDERRERERGDPNADHGPGHETYEEKQERWRRDDHDIDDHDYWSLD